VAVAHADLSIVQLRTAAREKGRQAICGWEANGGFLTGSDFSRDGNEAVNNGEYDANYFEHVPYLDSVKAEKGYDISSAGGIHVEPIGFYSSKWKSLKELPNNATFEIPNDATNEYRALKILETAGYLKLKAGGKVGQASLNDVEKYLKPIKIVEIDAGQLVRDLPDFDGAVVALVFGGAKWLA